MPPINESTQAEISGEDTYIEVLGAREHNLKNIDVRIPRGKLVVITGISGSGKSSIAFDTIYAEGQRRYMESFSAYARSFIGDMERPDVDKINGLSPVISIEQKTTSRNPRSTVGTVTEVYDFFRLLYARASEAYSWASGKKMEKLSEDQIIELLLERFKGQKVMLLAPLVKGRKGHYRELFQQIRKMGYTKARVNGEVIDVEPKTQLDRYKTHDIEVVIDRLVPDPTDRYRAAASVHKALTLGKGLVYILDANQILHPFSKYLIDIESGLSYDEPAPNTFSYNSPYGYCPECKGLGIIEEIRIESIIPDTSLSIARGAIVPLGEYRDIWIFKKIEGMLAKYKASLSTPIQDLPEELLHVLLYGSAAKGSIPSEKYPGTTYTYKFEGIIHFLEEMQKYGSEKTQQWVHDFTTQRVCPACEGTRLKKEALWFRIDNTHIAEVSGWDLQRLQDWVMTLEDKLNDRQRVIASEVLKEIRKRVGFLLDIGLGYLTMDRPMRTLSGGEAQRIRLATQIGTQLVGVLYIMDEPSIGLHQRDNQRLIQSLRQLRDLGNSILVVEHDKDMMLASDYLLDIGPGAGRHGGKIVAEGTPSEFVLKPGATADYLKGERQIRVPESRRKGNGKYLRLYGASGHNLKNVDLHLPLGTLVCITGVSGSGKSSLIHETLFPILNKHFFNARREALPYTGISGLEFLDKVIEVDQSPIGRTPRSNPATYTGVFSDIRSLFALLPEAKIRGYKPGRFSFNVKGGRCETCEGAGMKLIEMDFLPDVLVPCETCKGKRYNRETLEVRFKGKSIADVLDMTVEQAVAFFDAQPAIVRKIKTLHDVGLGYITLGQHATTLSGGEAQRVKLATELSRKDTGNTLYILDEPTTGLHFQDIELLLIVLQKLVDKGNTVLIIEHNLDVVKVADYIVDMGPEGGAGGGTICAQGSPEEVASNNSSHTGHYLKLELEQSLSHSS
jgi:excinuclease ABC subunit A